MNVFMYLLLAHFILDWGLQNQFVAENKHKITMVMLAHVSMWTLGICAVLAYFELFAWWKLIMLFVGHWIEDLYKARTVAKVNEEGISNFTFQLSGYEVYSYEVWKQKYFSKLLNYDQGFHILQILGCVFL